MNATRLHLVPILLLLAHGSLRGQYVPAELPLTDLPREHAYQRTLRDYLASLTEKDLAVERKLCTATPGSADVEEQYRLWLLTLHLPRVEPAALPAAAFTLKAIEGRKGLTLPAAPNSCQMLAWLARWDYPGNPYFGSAAVKRRALVLAIVDLVMLDYLHEHGPKASARSDFLGGNLIWLGYTFKQAGDVMPAAARAAMAAGLKKLVLRLERWGPTGRMTDMDLFAPVGLAYIASAIEDAEVRKIAESYSRRLFTEERFFHPAGYFVDVGCFDTSYNGISLYFAAWAALVSDWKFTHEAVEKAYRLRAHLCLPDPDGVCFGPSQMSSRTSADSPHDQWNFAHRPYATALITDEALHLTPLPSPETLKGAGERVAAVLNAQLATERPATVEPWRESHWSGSLNFAHEHYKKGWYTRRLQLEKESGPLLKPLYARKASFVQGFADCFVIARFERYAAVIHTGPIKGWPNGFGGGQLSAFWTPEAGAALLGRRRGMQGPAKDSRADWKSWPVHAVTGTLADGTVISSADIPRPEVQSQVKPDRAEVRVVGPIPGGPAYERRFIIEPGSLTIRTGVKLDEKKLTELHETLPIFLNDGGRVATTKMRIQWQIGDRWLDAEPRPTDNVKAVRIERHGGKVLLTLERPRRVQLSPKEWIDGYQSRATCRTLLIDLLEGPARKPGDEITIQYALTSQP